jgi:outer membrane protein
MNRLGWTLAAVLAAAPAALGAQTPAAGARDTVALSLDAAVQRALGQSEEVRLAQSQVEIAESQVREARAGALPQVSANVGYTRTFASSFSSGEGFTLPDSLRFSPDSTAPLAERVRYLEQNAPLAGLGGLGSLFGDLPFGQANAYVATLSGSQLLYSGGRTAAALRIAREFRQVARLGFVEQAAEIELQVRRAYVNALFAQELAASAQQALEQAEAFLQQEVLRLSAGRASELEVLRAEVSRDNLRPQLVEAQNAAELSLLNLKRLVGVPMDAPIVLTTPLDVPSAEALARPVLAAEALERRASVEQAERQVQIAEQNIRIARGAFLPNVSLRMNYGRLLYPLSPVELAGEWRTDWTAGLNVEIPLLSGGQRSAQLRQARIEAEQARLQLVQLREGVQLQYAQAAGERERARTAIAARQTTVQAAQRVYELTVLRYNQGLATQLEVSQARLELLQARTNLAQAVADFLNADAAVVRAVGGSTVLDAATRLPDGVRPLDTTPSIPNPTAPTTTFPAPAPVPATTTTTP